MNGKKLAFLGLGVMGYPMAGHLAKAGHNVTVFNRTPAKAAKWVGQHGGQSAPSPADAARNADIVLMCVGNDDDVRAVGTEALAAMPSGSILVDHTTASAEVAREMSAAAKARSVDFLDAPVSGGQVGAMEGRLTVMVGGDEAVCARLGPLFECYARAVSRQMPRSLRIQSTAKPKSNLSAIIVLPRFSICHDWAAPLLITSRTFSTSSPAFWPNAIASDNPCTSPAMQIWLTIFVN